MLFCSSNGNKVGNKSTTTQNTPATFTYQDKPLKNPLPVNNHYAELYAQEELDPDELSYTITSKTFTYNGETPLERYAEQRKALREQGSLSKGNLSNFEKSIDFFTNMGLNRDYLLSCAEKVLDDTQKWKENPKAAEKFCYYAAANAFNEIDNIPPTALQTFLTSCPFLQPIKQGIINDIERVENICQRLSSLNNPHATITLGDVYYFQGSSLLKGPSRILKHVMSIESYLKALEQGGIPKTVECALSHIEELNILGLEEKSSIVAEVIFKEVLEKHIKEHKILEYTTRSKMEEPIFTFLSTGFKENNVPNTILTTAQILYLLKQFILKTALILTP